MAITLKTSASSTSAPSTSEHPSFELSFGDCLIPDIKKNIQYIIECRQADGTYSLYNNYDTISKSSGFTINVSQIILNGGDPLINDNYAVSTNVLSTSSFNVLQNGNKYTYKYGDAVNVTSSVTITPVISQSQEKYKTGDFVFKNNKLLNVGTAYPGLYNYYANYSYDGNYYNFGYNSIVIPTSYDTQNMCNIYPSVEGLLYKTYISIGYNNNSYYDGILYEASVYNDVTGETIQSEIVRSWSYNYPYKSSGRHIAEICTDSTVLIPNDTSTSGVKICTKFEIKPYAYTRFKYPETIDRIVKCVDVISYFSNDNGYTYVKNGSISMSSSGSKAGSTEIFTSMPDKCVVYGSPAYLMVSIVPSTSGKSDEDYITKVNIYSYVGDKFHGTITMDATRYNTYRYKYIQQEKAYTFTFDVVTRQPKMDIVKRELTVPGVSWEFGGGSLSKTLTTDNNGAASSYISNVKSEYAVITLKSLSMSNQYRCLRPSNLCFNSDDFSKETVDLSVDGGSYDYRNFNHKVGGSSINQYNYDVKAYATFIENEKLVSYVTAYGGTWYINVPIFNVVLRTSSSYTSEHKYDGLSTENYLKFAYVTSLEISKSLTIQPEAAGYAYIGNVTVSKAKADGSGKTELVSFTANPAKTEYTEYVTAVSETTMLDTTYVTYVDAEVCAYRYPFCFKESNVGNYTVNVNNTTVKISYFDKTTSITPITYAEKINLAWAQPDNESYEFAYYNILTYRYKNTQYSGEYTTLTTVKGLRANTDYPLINLLSDSNHDISPYDLFIIHPYFEVTAAPAQVIITAMTVRKEYNIEIGGATKYVKDKNIIVASMEANKSVVMGNIKPLSRQYSWNSGSSTIAYTNTAGETVTKTGIKNYDVIQKPSELTGTLSSVKITPAFSTKTTFSISFERYKEAGVTLESEPNYSYIKWYDTDNTNVTSSLNSGSNYVILDTLLPAGDEFGIESITLDDTNYEITGIKSTVDNGLSWTARTIGKSKAWAITANTTVMPIVKQTVKEMYLRFLPVTDSDYTVVYCVDGVEQSPLNVGKSSSGSTTVKFKSSSKIKFYSITFESVEYSLNKIVINNTERSLNKEYSDFFNPSANYWDVKVTAKADYSKLEYKLNINAQNWTDNISDNFKYDVILSDMYFKLKTDNKPDDAYSISTSYVTIDSYKYCNRNTMTLPITYVGNGVPTSPNVDIMFYVDDSTYNYRVKSSGYSPYTATYTSSGDYNWSVLVSKAFEFNSQKQISYIVQVSATKYNFKGVLVPYDIKNQKSFSGSSIEFEVSKGGKTTYTLTDPKNIGVSPENYGIMVSKSQINVNNNWQDCKYKLALSPTTVPVSKSYASLNIINNDNYYSAAHKVSVKINNVNVFDNKNNEVVLSYLTKIGIPYKLNNPNKTTFSLTITAVSDKSFGLGYTEKSNEYFAQSDKTYGVLEYSYEFPPNTSISPETSTFYIKHIN